jgi:hypothetical protein
MAEFTYNDMLVLDSSVRKGLGEIVLYTVYTTVDAWDEERKDRGPKIFLNCGDALKYAEEFVLSVPGVIRQEVHKPKEISKIRMFKQYFIDRADEEDTYIVYEEIK